MTSPFRKLSTKSIRNDLLIDAGREVVGEGGCICLCVTAGVHCTGVLCVDHSLIMSLHKTTTA